MSKKHIGYAIVDSAQGALDAVAWFLFLTCLFLIIRVTLFRPYITPSAVRQYVATTYALDSETSWKEISERTSLSCFKELKNRLDLKNLDNLSTISQKQQELWPQLTQLDQS